MKGKLSFAMLMAGVQGLLVIYDEIDKRVKTGELTEEEAAVEFEERVADMTLRHDEATAGLSAAIKERLEQG